MRHDFTVEGAAFRLRPLSVGDAAFVVGLRTDEKLTRYLNPTSPDLADQIAWTERYFEREGDFNFIVERIGSGTPEGVVALYDEEPGVQAQWGRWVLRPGSLAAPESALMIYRFGIEIRGLPRIYCHTEAANLAVVQFHESSGLETVGPSPEATTVEQAVTPGNWAAVRERLTQGAQRSAVLLRRREG